MTLPKITVVMPVWNGEAHLDEAVRSIRNQTFKEFEFLILDDGSTDRTPAILAEHAEQDPRIRIIRLEHGGIVAALNRGVAESRADWIARMDSDDISYPTRLEKQWNAIARHPGTVLCHCHTRIIGDPGMVTPAGHFIRTKALLALRLCFQSPIVHPTVMFHKPTFLESGGYQASEEHAEDYGLWGRLMLRGGIAGVAEPLLDLRVHAGSISKQQAAVQQAITENVAVRHCGWFMNLDAETAQQAYRVFRSELIDRPFCEWIWFVLRCLPRMRWQSFEMWVWAAKYTLHRLSHSH